MAKIVHFLYMTVEIFFNIEIILHTIIIEHVSAYTLLLKYHQNYHLCHPMALWTKNFTIIKTP